MNKQKDIIGSELADALQKGKLENCFGKVFFVILEILKVVVESNREDREGFYSVVTTLKFENVLYGYGYDSR